MVTVRRRTPGRAAVAALLLAGLVLADAAVPRLGAVGCPDANGAVLTAARLQELPAGCDLEGAVVEVDGSTTRIPAPGERVLVWSIVDGGELIGYAVETGSDGMVRVLADHAHPGHALEAERGRVGHDAGALPFPAAATSSLATRAAVSRCADRNVRVLPGRWQGGTVPFLVNTAERRPSNVAGSTFVGSVDAALQVLRSGQTSGCGASGGVSLRTSVSLTSTADAAVRGDNGCGAADGRNVVDFGPVAGSSLAITCVWMTGGRISEADTRIDTTGRTWTASTSGCRGAYDLRGILTHELGHAVGLAHQPERGGADQTMSASAGPCEFAPRLLGIGDLLSLRDRY